MSDLHEKIGYISKAVEDVAHRISRHMEQEEKERHQMNARLANIEKDVSLVRFALKFAKALVWTAVLILTIRFGDVKTLWQSTNLLR